MGVDEIIQKERKERDRKNWVLSEDTEKAYKEQKENQENIVFWEPREEHISISKELSAMWNTAENSR